MSPETVEQPVTPQPLVSQPILKFSGSKWTFRILGIAIILLIAVLKFGCKFPNPVVVINPDKNQPVVVAPTSVTYTDAKTHQKKKQAKPLEGHVYPQPDGTVKVQMVGFCLIPKAGWTTRNHWYAGARVLFVYDFGLEAMANDQGPFLGVDYRLPVLNLITASAGVCTDWTSFQPSPYAGISATLSL